MPLLDGIIQPVLMPIGNPPQPKIIGGPQNWLQMRGPTILVEVGFEPPPSSASSPVEPSAASISDETIDTKVITAVETPQPPPFLRVHALVDTGASTSCIDEDLAQQLQLPAINQVKVGGAGGSHTLTQYLCRLTIPQLGFTRTEAFIGARLMAGGQAHKALIGRDFLSQMVVIYDGRRGNITLAV